ncbi:MAG: LemA family protein [Clostridiaceae bacterium]|nr:LemA family protein [Clostridiaceae bacterium]
MSAFSNRRTAASIMAAMIALSILLGAYRSGARLYSQVENAFYNGAKDNGIGIASDLTQRSESSVNLVTVAKRYLESDNSLLSNVQSAVSGLNSADSLYEKYQANKDLDAAMSALYDGMSGLRLSEKDESYRKSLYADFTSASMTMSHDSYNETAIEYNREISSFPGSIFFTLYGFGKAPVFR